MQRAFSEVILRCDNEPAIFQLQRLEVKTRQSMGLKTRMSSSIAYDHGNSLAENAFARVRQLAASLVHQLHGRIGIQLSSGSALWTWALRHAAWLISRFAVLRGATAFELAIARRFAEDLCMVNLCTAMCTQVATKQLQGGVELCFLERLTHRTAMSFSMASQSSWPKVSGASAQHGGATWPITFTANATAGNSNQALVQGFFQP